MARASFTAVGMVMVRHRGKVVAAWAAGLLACATAGVVVGPAYEFDASVSGSRAVAALQQLQDAQGSPSPATLTVAWRGSASDAAAVGLLERLGSTDGVTSVTGPARNPAQVSPSGVAYATVTMDEAQPSPAVVDAVIAVVQQASSEGLEVGATGNALSGRVSPSTASEVVGIAAAAVILVLAFGSLLAAGLPLAGALGSLGSALALTALASHAMPIPPFAPSLVALIAIGVGIDYALFVVSRHRAGLRAGRPVTESIVEAYATAGRSVLFAGVAVAISLGGLATVGIGFLNGLAVAAAAGVVTAVLAALTLLPALLSFAGMRILPRRDRKAGAARRVEATDSTRWQAWAAFVTRRPLWSAVAALLLLAAMAAPALDLRLGAPDQGADPPGSLTRVGYDLMAEGFGPGVNGPLLLVSSDGPALARSLDLLRSDPAVAMVVPGEPVAADGPYVATVIPVSGPQDAETGQLIDRVNRSGVVATGYSAVMSDFTRTLQDRLWLFLLVVIGLSSVLLGVVFRSVAIPLKAALMNVLAAAASFGVLVAVFQWGWGASLIGLQETGPVDAFLPVMLLAILFGLSMDYQVFLVSRIREEWQRTGDNDAAVLRGLGDTGRVITAAALIMVCVFAAFAFSGQRVIQMFGVGLATAIFVDAFVIRSLLVPALMHMLGKWNWWLPAWLDRVLPRLDVEPGLPSPAAGPAASSGLSSPAGQA